MTDNHLLLYRLAELMLQHEQHILPVDLLFDDEQIGDFVKSIQIDSPYQQMLLEGVLTESVRDEKLYVSFTVEGYFHYVLGEVIDRTITDSDMESISQTIIHSKLNGARSGLEEFFIKRAVNGKESIIYEFIDLYPDHLNLVIRAFALLITFNDINSVLDNMFEEFSDNDLSLLLEVIEYMYINYPATHIDLQTELINYEFLSQIESFKKAYLEALINSSDESFVVKIIDSVSSDDTKMEFLINSDKIKLYIKVNQYELAEKIIARNIQLLQFLELQDEKEALISFYGNISFYYSEVGKYNLAVEAAKKTLSFSDEYRLDYGVLLNNLALKYIDLRMFNEAQSCLEKALFFDLKKFGQYSRNVASRYGNFGLLYLEQLKYSEAITCIRKAVEIDRTLLGDQDENVATRLINLAVALSYQDQIEEALECVYEARSIDIANYGDKHPMVAFSYKIESDIYSKTGDYKKAIKLIKFAININKLLYSGINDRINKDYISLGKIYVKMSKYNNALLYFLKADKVESKLFIDNPELRIVTWLNICKLYLKMDDVMSMKKYLQKINLLPEYVQKEYSEHIIELSKL